MDRSIQPSGGMGFGSLKGRGEALNKENNNSNENISIGNESVGPVIRILEIEAKIDKEPTQIDESSSAVLKYRTPNFRYQKLHHISRYNNCCYISSDTKYLNTKCPHFLLAIDFYFYSICITVLISHQYWCHWLSITIHHIHHDSLHSNQYLFIY